MKRILGFSLALLLMSSLLSVVLADDPLWTQTINDATLTIDQTFLGNGVWKWTYTLTHSPELGVNQKLDSFNAQLQMYDGGAVPGVGFWGYATDSDTASGNPGYTLPVITRSTWDPPENWTQVFWTWTPFSSGNVVGGYPFGMKVFSLETAYGGVIDGNYNLTLGVNGNVHGFSGMAMPFPEIPEPGSLAMLGLAAVGFVSVRRQRR